MAQVVIARKTTERISAIRTFFAERDNSAGERAASALISVLLPLHAHPQMVRPAMENAHLRELAIPSGATGFAALYRFAEGYRRVVIPAIRHRRNADHH